MSTHSQIQDTDTCLDTNRYINTLTHVYTLTDTKIHIETYLHTNITVNVRTQDAAVAHVNTDK